MQLVQTLQLIVNVHQLLADMATVVDPRQAQQHGFNLGLAIDQHTALAGAGLVSHGKELKKPYCTANRPQKPSLM